FPKKIIGIYQKENIYEKKISAYYNFIFPKAEGKYFAFCECDDYWIDSNKLQMQIDFLEQNQEYVACTHECLEVDQYGKIRSKHYINSCFLRKYKLKNCVERFSLSGQTATIVARREALELPTQEAINDYSAMNCTGDIRMTLIMAIRGNLYHFYEVMSVYERNYENSSSWSGKMKKVNLPIFYFNEYEEMEQFVKKHLHTEVDFTRKRLSMIMHAMYRYFLYRRNEDMEATKYMLSKVNKRQLISFGGGGVILYCIFYLVCSENK
ncbi:MAG: hypothetical protein Q4F41_09815, partial [Eubacteriales bacterium]|nr:hypothetical protein [Eubacteriales bacterium]